MIRRYARALLLTTAFVYFGGPVVASATAQAETYLLLHLTCMD